MRQLVVSSINYVHASPCKGLLCVGCPDRSASTANRQIGDRTATQAVCIKARVHKHMQRECHKQPPPPRRCPGLCMNRTSKRGVVSCRQGGNHIFQILRLPAGTAAEVQALHPLPLPSYAASSSYTLARPLLRCDAAPLITCSANHTSIPPCCAPFSPRASSP